MPNGPRPLPGLMEEGEARRNDAQTCEHLIFTRQGLASSLRLSSLNLWLSLPKLG